MMPEPIYLHPIPAGNNHLKQATFQVFGNGLLPEGQAKLARGLYLSVQVVLLAALTQ